MLNTQLSSATANVAANAEAALFNSGFIDVYDGEQPADADTAVDGQVKLVRLGLAAKAFPKALDGVLVTSTIKPGVVAVIGNATWLRVVKADGKTVIMDGTVGTDDAFNLRLPTATLFPGMTVSCAKFTHTVAKSAMGL